MGLRLKLIFGVLAIAFLASGATGSYFYFQVKKALYKSLREELKASAKIAAQQINGDELSRIHKPEDKNTPAYKKLQLLMGFIAQSNEEFIFAYTMRNVNGQVRFIVDSPPSDDDGDGEIEASEMPAPVGEVYANPPESLLKGFIRPSADKRPWEGKWGLLISGYAPVFNEQGQSVGLLGIDMKAERVEHKLWLVKRAGYVSLAGALIVSLILSFYYSKQFMRPIRVLEGGVQKVAEGKFDFNLDYRKRDEIGKVIQGFNRMLKEIREKQLLKTSLGKVMDVEVAEVLIKDEFKLGGEIVETVFMFCDLRGFTELCSKLPPVLLVKLLNDYFTSMVGIIEKYGGIVDKFDGDAVMAVFGHPKKLEYPENMALQAGLEMLKVCDELNKKQELNDFALVNSIGLHCGTALAGVIGSPDRAEFSFIGRAVNIASRLENETRRLKTRLAVSGEFFSKLSQGSEFLSDADKFCQVGNESIKVFMLQSR